MATIVQNYGPIYGEVVNGTVQGRPNGSVFVPISNTISLKFLNANITHVKKNGNFYMPCNSSGTLIYAGVSVVAQSQDLASNWVTEVYSDSELTTRVGLGSGVAGNFNQILNAIAQSTIDIVNGETYYVIAKLMNNGEPVAVSSVLTVVGFNDSE